jgi:hypothetical protein
VTPSAAPTSTVTAAPTPPAPTETATPSPTAEPTAVVVVQPTATRPAAAVPPTPTASPTEPPAPTATPAPYFPPTLTSDEVAAAGWARFSYCRWPGGFSTYRPTYKSGGTIRVEGVERGSWFFEMFGPDDDPRYRITAGGLYDDSTRTWLAILFSRERVDGKFPDPGVGQISDCLR